MFKCYHCQKMFRRYDTFRNHLETLDLDTLMELADVDKGSLISMILESQE